jgi:hypothetical protein
MNCGEARKAHADLLVSSQRDRSLDPVIEKELSAHLEACADCRQVCAVMQTMAMKQSPSWDPDDELK